MDYIKWRGDLPFDRDPLNSVDAVIFASIAYMDFGGVIPEHGEITFREASEKFFELLQQICAPAPQAGGTVREVF